MRLPRKPFICAQCRLRNPRIRIIRQLHMSSRLASSGSKSSTSDPSTWEPIPTRPTMAPKVNIDIKHIRENPDLYQQNCIDRNYKKQSNYPARIVALHQQWQEHQRNGRSIRERSNLLRRQIANPAAAREDDSPVARELSLMTRGELLGEGKRLKQQVSSIEGYESRLTAEMEELAFAMPNLTSKKTPRGNKSRVLSYINDHPEPRRAKSDRVWRSHVHIGSELGLLDFSGAATASGWGWYYLLDEGAQLEQALIQFALSVATKYGWRQVTPPSMVYSHIASACGFQPRDQNGETQIYAITQSADDKKRGKPELVLAGTAEIPLAGMKADTIIEEAELPLKRIGVSRCYRAEAGARGVDTKGLYRVHEFNKVEMFAWTAPDDLKTTDVFEEMLDVQTEILQSLGLHCRVLEMPTADLGASAARKCDMEAFFPSRSNRKWGWGEVTSASICTDYQTRRLATRVKVTGSGGVKVMTYPWTVNGTALAVPRVLAALLEIGWDEAAKRVRLPECLWEAMGKEVIERPR